MKTKKMLCAVVMVMMLAIMFTVPAFAAGTGDVAGAIEGTWTDASAQIKTVVNNVVFPEVLPKSWTKVMRQSHFEFCIGQDLTHSIFL